ncbi:fluoride efflux transporter CrcB [Bacillus sp. V33-4]|uniref:fluoride efflux transporter CrcB n=1 Tax=Bacillus sp. V33-4 TaxID=2054169 RepID=UPI000C767BCE|nr:fluoride efflux transporter CrcB [Bacillus sp. V33-4]PLR85650.1 fluoride efflux transporter CrcB [Bacillus sp. V33-4]
MIWLIGLGGSFGAAARYILGTIINKRTQRLFPFPTGTWLINITGSFLLGFIANLHIGNQIEEWGWFLFGVGFCGAFTTFSTFGYEVIMLLQSKDIKLALIYVLSSIILSGIAVAIGLNI